MGSPYIGILVLMALAGFLAAAMTTLSWLLGPKNVTVYKQSAYECGVQPVGDTHERFPVKFYLVAIVFIMFDIESVFLWSWYTVYKNSPDTSFMVFSCISFLTYMATYIVGYVYAIRVGAMDWDESTSLAPEKLGLSSKEELDAQLLAAAGSLN